MAKVVRLEPGGLGRRGQGEPTAQELARFQLLDQGPRGRPGAAPIRPAPRLRIAA